MSAFSSVVFGLGVGLNFKPRFNNFISAFESSREDKLIILGSVFVGSSVSFSAAVVVNTLDGVVVDGWVDVFFKCFVLKNSFCFGC